MLFEAIERGHEVSKAEYKERQVDLRVDLLNAQFDLLSRRFSALVMLAGDDRESLAEVMDLAHEWMDARLIDTGVFAERLPEEQEFPDFWRFWRALPADGRVGVFYGGWALGTVVLRLQKKLTKKQYKRRVQHAQELERLLADDGMLILKLWLHTPRKKLKKRLLAAKKRNSSWRQVELDQLVYDKHDDLVAIGEDFVRETDAPHAPWVVVESTDDEYRNLTSMEAIRTALVGRLGDASATSRPPVTTSARQTDGRVVLDSVDLTKVMPRDEYDRRLAEGQARLTDLSLHAHEKGLPTVLVFQGWDASGKGGAIRRLTTAMAARDYRVIPIAAPTDEELAHHYLWRFWRKLPRDGHVAIFDRSWYGRVLVERVEGFASEAEWRRAYGEIVDFEEQLVEHGTLVRKFWLHIDPDEQLRRFQEREKTHYKKYKITDEDYRNREQWDAYATAVQDMVERTHTRTAPWVLVAANDKRHARITVLEEVCAGLEQALR